MAEKTHPANTAMYAGSNLTVQTAMVSSEEVASSFIWQGTTIVQGHVFKEILI